MPDTNLYDNNGEFGGSQYPNNSLFKTGIKNSLQRA